MRPNSSLKNSVVWAVVVSAGLWAHASGVVGAQDTQVEFEGPAMDVRGTCPTLMFSVNDTTISTTADTEFEDGACTEVRGGTRVEVDGVLGSDGRVIGSEIVVTSPDSDDDDDDDDEDEDDDDDPRRSVGVDRLRGSSPPLAGSDNGL